MNAWEWAAVVCAVGAAVAQAWALWPERFGAAWGSVRSSLPRRKQPPVHYEVTVHDTFTVTTTASAVVSKAIPGEPELSERLRRIDVEHQRLRDAAIAHEGEMRGGDAALAALIAAEAATRADADERIAGAGRLPQVLALVFVGVGLVCQVIGSLIGSPTT